MNRGRLKFDIDRSQTHWPGAVARSNRIRIQ